MIVEALFSGHDFENNLDGVFHFYGAAGDFDRGDAVAGLLQRDFAGVTSVDKRNGEINLPGDAVQGQLAMDQVAIGGAAFDGG